MGWSCRADAMRTLQKWEARCRADTGSSNVYLVGRRPYMFETSNREHDDRAITGSIMELNAYPEARFAIPRGSFRIEGDGAIARAPKALKGG